VTPAGNHATSSGHDDDPKKCLGDQHAQVQEIRALQVRLAMALQCSGDQNVHVQQIRDLLMHRGMALRANARAPANQDEQLANGLIHVAKRQPSASFQMSPVDLVKNVPELYNNEEFRLELDHLMPQGSFDFVFLHMSRRSHNRGYAFVNCITHESAVLAFTMVMGHIWQKHQGPEILAARVSWAEVQGLTANHKMRQASMMKQMALKKARHHGKKHPFVNNANKYAGNTCKGATKRIFEERG